MSMRKSPGLRLQTSIVQDNIPVEIAAGLFVGSIHAAFNVEALKSNKISHVLNLAGSYATFPEDFTYLSLSIRDKEYASLLSCLPIAAVFIDAGLKQGGVLVHCAGGRSRSPAVAMAFLMMKQQMSYSAISAHVKALRPVVSLNVGFDAQLKCLETACGDVFIANQHLLKARLARLAQQHQDGELNSEVARKRRQSQQASDPPPLLKKQSSIEMLASGCDNRGMLGERVPCGFCLSLPPGMNCAKTAPEKPSSSFIPALRSMGTMFGCQCCGESLFCAGAIVHHHDISKITAQVGISRSDSGGSCFLGALRGQVDGNGKGDAPRSTSIEEGHIVVTTREAVTKKPLLAKLRLRPHSPNVTVGNGTCAGVSTDTSSSRRKSASPVLTKPNLDPEREGEGNLSQPLQILQPARRPATEESKRTGSATLSPNKSNGEPKKKPGAGLWRSLTSFKPSKRTAKDPHDEKSRQNHTGIPELQKPSLPSFVSDDTGSSGVQTPAHLVFLKRNAADWHRNIQQLVDINHSTVSHSTGAPTVEQMARLVHEDSTVIVALNDCKQWFVDPQSWTIDQAAAHPEGAIRCPREACGAIVGEWRWEGLRFACGGSVAPAFVMKRDAVCVLGNMTSQSSELMAIASSAVHREA